jgi:hypothetical protein
MTNQERLWRHLSEKQMLEIMLPEVANDEETLNLLLDRYNELKRIIFELEQKIEKENDDAHS